ncbi:glycosyltransferase family 9 protein [Candidatus Pelagibacter sp.]|nr:glycosyltransferase family 9 protein [Candidatus Pelagibacter sp.]
MDHIGDYVLFRNYIELIKKSKKYKDYSITLLGNSVWKDFSEELDNKYIDNFISLDREKFEKNFIYRYKKLQELASSGYEVILSPVYSREFFVVDNIVKLVPAKKKIGSIGNCSNLKRWQKNISDNYYTTLVDAKKQSIFEFNRNKEFFENLFKIKIDIIKPNIFFKNTEIGIKLPKKYAILFLGGTGKIKKWGLQNFAKIGNYLKKQYGYDIVLCGAPSDKKDAKEFLEHYDGDILNLVGKTSLINLSKVIYYSDFILSNDTLAPHIAVALKKKCIFVIYNGNHFGRFIPYPKEITKNFHVIYHPFISKNLNIYKKLSNSYGFKSNLDINEISFDMVRDKINQVMKDL